jgi:CheY-like chemotaxis protein
MKTRSPLHGILGSTEVLRDLDLNSMASTLAGQIDSCGRTLLDIIDHLLDFATLKGQRVEKSVASNAKIRRRISLKESKTSVDEDLEDIEASVALDDLTEEAVESTVYSFNCKKGTDYEPRTSVILDIDRSVSNQWYCGIATGGWRRICINLITNALKYTPAGYIRVSLTQKPRPGSKRFDAVFTVSDSGKGMSKEFLENRLFQDFSQEDTLADGIGLGMHMVGRIVHTIGAKIDVVSEQSGPGAGTSVTVTVPLEHSQNRQNTNDTIESTEMSVQVIPAGLQVNIIGHHSPPISEETRDSHLMSTAFTLAVASLEKSCDALGFRLHKGDSRDCDINFIFEPEFEYSVRAQDSEDRLRHFSRKPCIVICNSNPSGKTIKASRDKAIIRMGSAVEYIAMPCGIKTIARAITSALTRQKQLDATAPNRSAEDQKPLGKSTGMMKHVNFKESEAPLSVQPEIPGLVVRSATGSNQTVEESKRAEAVSSGQKPNVQQTSTRVPGPSGSNPKATSDEPTTTTAPKPPSPVLLLVDDNKVNLQLLTMYARKNKYAYLAATDGLMAFNTYQKAHEDSATTPGAPGSTVPGVILMDINMPIMDGYEATQHIRTYEKKHQLPGAKIIALTALGSEAAYQEAFGSGCDMFLTKPVKLKDLTKIIEEM